MPEHGRRTDALPGQLPEYLDRLRFPADPWRLTESFYEAADLGTTETLYLIQFGLRTPLLLHLRHVVGILQREAGVAN